MLASETLELNASVFLANHDLPYYLANAAWFFGESPIEALRDWYAARELPAAIITEPKSVPSAFKADFGVGLREAQRASHSAQVEQVNWTQMQAFANVLTQHYAQPKFAFLLAKHLASLLQKHNNMLAFMSYEQTPTGAMFVYETEDTLFSMLTTDPSQGLETRLKQEAQQLGKTALMFEPDQEKDYLLRLERWILK